MLDLTDCLQIASDYEGSERKFALMFENEPYMIKEPDPVRRKNSSLSYMNNTFSEHIGCKIFEMLDLPAQKTFLATYTRADGKSEIVVACKDFRGKGQQLYEADKFAKSLIDSASITKPDFSDIEKIFQRVRPNIDEDPEERFWDIFVVDALIGNKDRHLGNWGFLSVDKVNLTLAPVYDCGSSLGALVEDDLLDKCLKDEGLLSNAECNIHLRFTFNKESCTYRDILFSPPPKLKESIEKIVPKIKVPQIHELIDSIEGLSNNRKNYIKRSISLRYNTILKTSLNKLRKLENGKFPKSVG